ncbi:MAG: hypothetical protein QNJ33_02825 [Crocosphaera sp.]|nr:hypothetical protein [Crocosphaera sp.]
MAMTDEVITTRANGDDVWSADATNTGVTYSGRDSLELIPPIFPKLWRRLNSYSMDSDVGNPNDLREFIEYLNSLREERILIIPEQRITGFDNILEVNGNVIRMIPLPEDIIIISR